MYVLVAHMGLTKKGSIGATTAFTLEESAAKVQAIHDAAKRQNPEVILLCHGGPIANPEDVTRIFEQTKGVDGFFGASSTERLPTEITIRSQVAKFKAIKNEY